MFGHATFRRDFDTELRVTAAWLLRTVHSGCSPSHATCSQGSGRLLNGSCLVKARLRRTDRTVDACQRSPPCAVGTAAAFSASAQPWYMAPAARQRSHRADVLGETTLSRPQPAASLGLSRHCQRSVTCALTNQTPLVLSERRHDVGHHLAGGRCHIIYAEVQCNERPPLSFCARSISSSEVHSGLLRLSLPAWTQRVRVRHASAGPRRRGNSRTKLSVAAV